METVIYKWDLHDAVTNFATILYVLYADKY
jgi:hypothetical protein